LSYVVYLVFKLLYGVYNTNIHAICWSQSFVSALGYALSSVEGQVSMELFDLSESAQSKRYVFCTLAS
jgi:hypothetical protein